MGECTQFATTVESETILDKSQGLLKASVLIKGGFLILV